MKKTYVMAMCIPLISMLVSSCATVSNLTGKPTYDPSSYGTAALIETIRSPDSGGTDSAAAARQLAQRNLSEEDGRALMAALLEQKNRKTSIALLQTMVAKQMTYLREDLVAYAQAAPDSETAVESAMTVVALTSDPLQVAKFAGQLLLKGTYPAQRARAARLIAANFPEYAERLFIKALEKETSASAATLMCEYLAQKGTAQSLPVLDKIANDVNRIYQADNYLDVKTTAESVRAAAVRGSERLRGQ